MSNETELPDPPQSFIMTGYYLTIALNDLEEYLKTALACIDQGVEDADEAGTPVPLNSVNPAKREIYEVLAKAQDIKKAHNRLRKIMILLGYREIVDADFEELGAGGNRRR